MSDYLQAYIKQMKYYKGLADKAISPLNEHQINWQFNPESNSIAMIMRHISGNMISRFTDFLTSDGEKSWRNRESEFDNGEFDLQELINHWESGWKCFLTSVENLVEADLDKIVYIRDEGHTVVQALDRQLAHYPYHIGQIVYISRMIQGADWKSLSIPRGHSDEFNKEKFEIKPERVHFTDTSDKD
jgi:hypothetical protein